MAELATIARPYAEALYQSLSNEGNEPCQWVDQMAEVAANGEVLALADNPRVTSEQVYEVICGVLPALPETAVNFLRLLIDNGRLNVLPEIATQYRALVNGRLGMADAVVHSAYEIDAASLSDLSALLEKRFSRRLNVTVKVTPELIGGIRVVVGDEVLDTSVQARLEQMKVALTA